jgi:hypothetical protein
MSGLLPKRWGDRCLLSDSTGLADAGSTVTCVISQIGVCGGSVVSRIKWRLFFGARYVQHIGMVINVISIRHEEPALTGSMQWVASSESREVRR